MLTQSYKTIPNLSSNFLTAVPTFLDKIIAFDNKNQVKSLLKIPVFDKFDMNNFLKTVPNYNLIFIIDKCYQIALEIGKFKDFPENDKLKDLHFIVFDISEMANQITQKNQINLFV